MLNEILVIDDAISTSLQEELEGIFLGPSIPWSYVADLEEYAPEEVTPAPEAVDYKQFVHLVYHAPDNIVKPSFPLFVSLLSAIPIEIEGLLRIKVNMTTIDPTRPKNSYGPAHVDYTPPVKDLITCIYYFNDSDGDTVMFSQVGNRLIERQRISPKRGRLVVFDGNIHHSGNCPSTPHPRVVANINFIPRKK